MLIWIICILFQNSLWFDSDKNILSTFVSEDKEGFTINFGKITGYFNCSNLDLISLKGAPQEVRGDFYCSGCEYLTSLEGAPKKVSRCFTCSGCNVLTSLKGAPKEVGGAFYCLYCRHLNSLKGAPKKVGGDFNCYGCAGKFTIEDVKKVSNVRGEIKCWKWNH